MTLALIPHHAQLDRRRRERGRTLLSSSKDERPQHYPRRRTTADTDSPIQVGALYQGYGTHYADLWCGTPPQRQTVIVDTGSGVTAFPCSGCKDCGVPKYHIDQLFTEVDSVTFQAMSCAQCLRGHCSSSGEECRMSMSYQEGSSWNAYEGQDSCYVGGLHDQAVYDNTDQSSSANSTAIDLNPAAAAAFSFPLKFGCQTRLTGLFKTQLADGIMGMDDNESAFWSQMYVHKKITKQRFSLCFSRSPTADRTGTGAGAMTLGGTDKRLHNSDVMVYADTEHSMSGFYSVHVRKMYLRAGGGGDSAMSNDAALNIVALDVDEGALNSGQVILDSGTTDTYFTRRISSAFEKVFKDMTGEDYTHASKKMSKKELDAYPTILIQMVGDDTLNKAARGDKTNVVGLADILDPDHPNDVILAIPPSHYFEYDDDTKNYKARFYTDEGSGSVLGANAMMGHDILFDVDNKQVGFAESTCDYEGLVKPFIDTKGYLESKYPIEPSRQEHSETSKTGDNGQTLPADIDGLCSSLSCQMAFVVGVVAAVSLAAYVAIRRSPTGPSYILPSELELQTTPPSNDSEDDEFPVRYRDAPADDGLAIPAAAPAGTGYSDDEEDGNVAVGKLT